MAAQASRKLNVLLTGGTAGVGLRMCQRLASEGHQVVVLCRSKQRFEQTTEKALTAPQRGLVSPVVCDVGCIQSVREAASELKDKHSHFDVVVLNAGVMKMKQQATTPEGYEETLAVNHLGQFLLANEVMPLLLKGEAPRLVLVSSELHKSCNPAHVDSLFQYSPACQRLLTDNTTPPPPYNGRDVYGMSKLYNVWTGRVLAERAGSKLWVASVSPGFIPSTSLSRDSASWLARWVLQWVMSIMSVAVSSRAYEAARELLSVRIRVRMVDEGAGRVLQVATDPSAPSQCPSGGYWARRQPDAASELSRDMNRAQRMWDLSMEALGIEDFLGPKGQAAAKEQQKAAAK